MGDYLNFLEVGTSDFNTIIESCPDDYMGISIEPLKFYLDDLPSKPHVKKLAVALVPEPISHVDVYYIHPEKINTPENKINGFMKGCNSVGKPHDFHLNYNENSTGWVDENTVIRNLIEEGLVSTDKVLALTFEQVMKIYNVDYIDYIKLDTEGLDADLIQSMLDYYEKTKLNLPKIFEFETNKHNNKEALNNLAERLISLNYQLQIGDSYYDTFEELNGDFQFDCIATLIEK